MDTDVSFLVSISSDKKIFIVSSKNTFSSRGDSRGNNLTSIHVGSTTVL